MPQALPISRLVNVDVILTPAAASFQNISTLLILGSSDVIDTHERYRSYASIDEVATDFGTSAEEYLAAVLYFEQAPKPKELLIGRWAEAATKATLVGGALSAAEKAMSVWNAFTTPKFVISIDGTEFTIAPASFAADTNLNGVAAKIQTALAAAVANSTCVWDATYSRFVIKSGTTGATSTLSFASVPGTGQDISGALKMLSTSSGAYVVDGIAAEEVIDAVTTFDINYGQLWYALYVIGAVNADHLLVADYIEAAVNKHIYGVTTQEAGVLVAGDTTNIAYQLKELSYTRTAVQYSSSNDHAVVSLFARILTVDYNGNNTVITLMYKQEPGIVAETLNSTQITNLEGYNCNVFVNYRNDTAIIEQGKMASGDFIDIITGTDWLALAIQTTIYNLLYTSPTKIPQTDKGNQILATGIESECARAVTNGLIAPGTWDSAGFGGLEQGDFLPKGYYVYAPPVASQNAQDRAARKSVLFQVAVKLAGAIHTVDVQINVNR